MPASSDRWLTRTVLGIGLASLCMDASHDMATAVLPAFLASLGAGGAAGAAWSLGLVEGVADAAASAVKLAAGLASDRLTRRKPLAVAGYTLTGLATGALALATGWRSVMGIRVVAWLGRFRSTVVSSMLADAVPASARGRAFGFYRALDTTGAVIGPLVAMALLGRVPLRAIFAVALVPGLISPACYLLVTEPRRLATSAHPPKLADLLVWPRGFGRYLLAVGLFGAGNFAPSLLILRATQLLTPGFGPVRAGALGIGFYVLNNVVLAAVSYPAGHFGDRLGKRPLLALGFLAFGLASAGFALPVASPWALAGLFALAGAAMGLADPLEGAMAGDLLPPERRGGGYGALAAVNGVGDLVSSALVGVLWTVAGPAWGFGLAAALAALGALALAFARLEG